MKKVIKVIVGLLAVAVISLLVSFIIYSWPKTIDMSYTGIMLRTGDTMPEYSESITVVVYGDYTKWLFGDNVFKGQFQIIGLETDDIDDFPVTILFDRKGRGGIVYREYGPSKIKHIGFLYLGENWDDMFITISEVFGETPDGNSSHWNPSDGIIIGLPSSNRGEALIVANKIYQEYYKPLEIGLMK